jgi:hypothetical protein
VSDEMELLLREFRVALQRIAENGEGWSDCECECDDENCCEKQDEWCPHCIAQTALNREAARATQSASQASSKGGK